MNLHFNITTIDAQALKLQPHRSMASGPPNPDTPRVASRPADPDTPPTPRAVRFAHAMGGEVQNLRVIPFQSPTTDTIRPHLSVNKSRLGSTTSTAPPNLGTWFAVLLVWRKVEMTLFCVEESIISGLYIQSAINFFGLKASIPGNPPKKRLAMPLLVVNGFVIFLDIILLATTYATLSTIQPALRALVYSIKLKVEINLLNSLVGITRQSTISTLPDIAVTPTSTKTLAWHNA
ncbi:hypothetical protein J7T55_015334 [Diaporthe amygdali]|uniref:uncharacterized protein n=1 Tax=Phomopsis amygdali TaxID=1214568 RepID=UPI0022FE85A7|nr:uncharacterized protein J7T55_015334 [Diaporthe amygdali]KAJ0120604.1 hypothetical protein J7T55_015334 [Diaporthe amygdali]